MIPTCVIPQDLSVSASPQFVGLKLTGLQASQAVLTDANKNLVSADYLDQAVKTTSSPYFTGIKYSTSNGDFILTTCSLQSGLAIVNSGSYLNNILRLYGSLGNGTQWVGLQIINYGTISSLKNSERIHIGWVPSSSRYVFYSHSSGTGTRRSMAFGADTNSGATVQLVLDTSGCVGIQNASPSSTLDVNGTISCNWLTVKTAANGTFTSSDGKTITVQNGIVTSIV